MSKQGSSKKNVRERYAKTKTTLILWLMLMAFFISASGQQTAEEWLNEGLALYNQSRYDEALQAYDKAIEIDPQCAEAWFNKGNALDKQSAYESAIKAYEKAIKINPQLSAAWINKGLTLRHQRKARPQTGTFLRDTADRTWFGELNVINDNPKFDAIVVLTKTDKVPLIAVFIRSKESYKISAIPTGTYYIYYKLGNIFDSTSDEFKEKGGNYRLAMPIDYKSTVTMESNIQKIRYPALTMAIEGSVPNGNVAMKRISVPEEEFPI